MRGYTTAVERFKRSDVASYNLFAQRWDHYSDKLSGPYAPRLLELADVAPGQRVLEVCCGTGAVSRAAARVVGPDGSVLGIDITPEMVRVASESAAASGIANAEFRVMDVEALDLPDAAFDAVVAMYPHFQDARRALAEVWRVLRPGGRVAVGVGGGLSRPGETRPTPLAVRMMLDILRRHLPEDPGTEAPAWAGSDPTTGLPTVLAEAGFIDLATDVRTRDTSLETPEGVWEVWSMTSTPVRHRLAALPPPAREAVRREFLEAFRPLANEESLSRRTGAVFGAGRKPEV
jgi:O-methyltransferase/aklanonic acid methyltransferase